MKWRLLIVAVLILVVGVEGVLAWLFLRIGLGQSDQVASVLSLLLAVITATATVTGALRQRDRGTNLATTPVPAQLEAATRYFTGRAAEVARLAGQLRRSTTAPTVVLISGTAGVGKTALAMHWAHRSRVHFPHGQLHVNLQGYHPDQAVPPRDALAVFLSGLGVAGPSIPEGLDERTALYRSLVAGRRILVVLDNAASADQVRPLLPGTGPSMVLITSRDTLAGLSATTDVTRISLSRMPDTDSLALLSKLVGTRAEAEPAALRAVADGCSGLPLALRIAAQRLAENPAEPLAQLAQELVETTAMTALSPTGDSYGAIRTVFSWSYRRLPGEAERRALRMIGVHPGPDFDAYAVAALTSTTLGESRRLLTELARANLVEPRGDGRFALHDLLRQYALDLAGQENSVDEARRRLFDHYLASTSVAIGVSYPSLRTALPAVASSAAEIPELLGPETARAWLQREIPVLVRVVTTAERHLPRHAVDLARTLSRHLDTIGMLPTSTAVHEAAVRAATRLDDPAAFGAALHDLAAVELRRSRYGPTREYGQRALAAARRANDSRGQASVLLLLGLAAFWQGERARAMAGYREALDLAVAAGDEPLQGRIWYGIGTVLHDQQKRAAAADAYRKALDLAVRHRDEQAEAAAHSGLGRVAAVERQADEATGHHTRAIDMLSWLGDRTMLVGAFWEHADSLRDLDQLGSARDRYEQALDLAQELGDPGSCALILNALAETLLRQGRRLAARRAYERAAVAAAGCPDDIALAEAYHGLAGICVTCHRRTAAWRYATEARRLYALHNHPAASTLDDFIQQRLRRTRVTGRASRAESS
ncbi:NB-ARC domain-containing protein [Solwaraspora sp. WMMA2080]|uniref:ATP-binding protein n=1 Tax=unclassified Solwaraspora TaxID=2627926 RepID=UPI00248C2042|nr:MULTISPECIES: tetratricopeptide repeat protein [unclassified Solwaraspora]WBB99847.1 NB-ARC domain-containing protein [Solwaraspora sp. WMMA2059]WBC21605.1 NB-ARC domain-containing protein [Solwaraspora sp. WMMA2080]